jgi:uncharacterized membrane protein
LNVGGLFDAAIGIAVLGFVVTLAVPIVIVIAIVWAVRRGVPKRRDPAEEALRDRLARGEIDMAEFQVRLRALRGEEG